MVVPPLGESKAAAGICSAAFLVMAMLLVRLFRTTKFRLYMIMGLAAALRGIALAIRASTITAGESTVNQSIVSQFFTGAGFGITIAIQCLNLAGWFKNTAPAPPLAKPARILITALFPTVIVFGPVLGLTSALLMYEDGTPDALDHAAKLRKASFCGMLGVASVGWLMASGATLWAASTDKGLRPTELPHHKICVLVVTAALLVWSAATRVTAQFQHPEVLENEEEYFPLVVLPELLQLIIWTISYPGPLMARVHLSTRWEEWWEETHGSGLPKLQADADARLRQLPGTADGKGAGNGMSQVVAVPDVHDVSGAQKAKPGHQQPPS